MFGNVYRFLACFIGSTPEATCRGALQRYNRSLHGVYLSRKTVIPCVGDNRLVHRPASTQTVVLQLFLRGAGGSCQVPAGNRQKWLKADNMVGEDSDEEEDVPHNSTL